MSIELLALDIDGTLLDPYGALTDAARVAVGEARAAGLEIVLCTGRRYRTALPLLRELALEGMVVVNNGVLVKDVANAATLHHAYFPADLYAEAFALMSEAGAPLVYIDGYAEGFDMLVEAYAETHPFQSGYLDDHGEHCRFVEGLSAPPRTDVIMLSRMADEATLTPLRERISQHFGEALHSHLIWNKNYQGLILELLSATSGKWRALEHVARSRGIDPQRIAAVGDDHNDTELVHRAGFGIAMGNAVEELKQGADLVVRSNAEGGVVEAIHAVLNAI
ncbi:MAG: HAD family hydrolase [Deltaproteobacteria bacterium]|nr:HAD family hydrolase [Deltaproteobacteria bacterium]MBW2362339.1 HAD family hydrolase [Deltaproteobacteria bacterium]